MPDAMAVLVERMNDLVIRQAQLEQGMNLLIDVLQVQAPLLTSISERVDDLKDAIAALKDLPR